MIQVLHTHCHTRYGQLVWDNIIGLQPDELVDFTLLEKLRLFLDQLPNVESIACSEQLIPLLKKLNNEVKLIPFDQEISKHPQCFLAGCSISGNILGCVLSQVEGNATALMSQFDLSSHHFTDEMKWLMKFIGENYLKESLFA